MARPKTEPDSRQILPYISKYAPYLSNPSWAPSAWWRQFERAQPLMMLCRDVLSMQVTNLDWKITAKDPERAEELVDEIDYYTLRLNTWNGEDYDTGIERSVQDLYTLPFGTVLELGRYKDGSLAWIKSMDGATCLPTLDPDFPVVQSFVPSGQGGTGVLFPKELVSRVYLSPRPEWDRQGWGMAPPEKVYIAGLMLANGDRYYWRLLLDTPQSGILDLGDMEEASAKKWIATYQEMLVGIDPQKIAVLYEHTKPANWIKYDLNPAELQMDKALSWYATIVTDGYGVPLSELGLNFNSTLAGQIREDRRSRRTGFGLILAKMTVLINRILPDYLQFSYVYRDDEGLNLLGRARATSVTGLAHAIDKGILSPEAARVQLRLDGLIDDLPAIMSKDYELEKQKQEEAKLRKDTRNEQREIEPDEGGHGTIKKVSEKADLARITSEKEAVERAFAQVFPIIRAASRRYNEEELVEFGQSLARAIIGGEADNREVLGLSPEITLSLEEQFLAASAAVGLAAPWSRKYMSGIPHPIQLRGTPVYSRMRKLVCRLSLSQP